MGFRRSNALNDVTGLDISDIDVTDLDISESDVTDLDVSERGQGPEGKLIL